MNFNGQQSSTLSLCGEVRLDLKGTDVPNYATFTELMFSSLFFFNSLSANSPLARRVHPLLSLPETRCSGNRPFVTSSREQSSLLGLKAGCGHLHLLLVYVENLNIEPQK